MAKTTIKEEKEELDLTKVKEELTDYIDLQIKKGFTEELEKAHNKLIREKNKRLFFKNIWIIFLLCLSAFLIYLLYVNNYFDKFFTKNEYNIEEKSNIVNKEDTSNTNNDPKEDPKEEIKGPTLEELKSEYAHLLDNIYINENSTYLKDYYEENLTKELKNYLALNIVDFDALELDDDSYIISLDILNKACQELFDEKCESSTFDYDGIKIKYIKGLNSYLASSELSKNKSHIEREIINVEVNNKIVKITTIEGLIKNDKLYNILTNNEIRKYSKKDNLTTYEDKLNKIVYTFNDEKLESITK